MPHVEGGADDGRGLLALRAIRGLRAHRELGVDDEDRVLEGGVVDHAERATDAPDFGGEDGCGGDAGHVHRGRVVREGRDDLVHSGDADGEVAAHAQARAGGHDEARLEGDEAGGGGQLRVVVPSVAHRHEHPQAVHHARREGVERLHADAVAHGARHQHDRRGLAGRLFGQSFGRDGKEQNEGSDETDHGDSGNGRGWVEKVSTWVNLS